MSIDQSARYLKCDFNTKTNYSGTQDPAIAVVVRDLYDIGSGFAIMCPTYRWSKQLIRDIPTAVMEKPFYHQPLNADDGTRVGDILRVCDAGRPLMTVSGWFKPSFDDCVLAGQFSDIPVRSGMGFKLALHLQIALPPFVKH